MVEFYILSFKLGVRRYVVLVIPNLTRKHSRQVIGAPGFFLYFKYVAVF